jgi:septal ring factor EnvC (AmiA/AmiB activator)
VGLISSKAVSITDACDYTRQAAYFLEDLKNKEVDREGNPFYFWQLWFSDSFHWLTLSWSVISSAQVAVAQKALADEKSARSDAAKDLAEEKITHLATEQTLKDVDKTKAKVAKALETTHDAYIVTWDKLTSKSKELDDMAIREQKANTLQAQAEKKLTDAEKKLATTKEEKRNQGLLLELA